MAVRIGVRRSLPDQPSRSTARRRFSSVFRPNPGRFRIASVSKAAMRLSTESTPSALRSRTALLGPRPGTRTSSRNSGGYSSRSPSSLATLPVSTYSRILEAEDLPIPEILLSSVSDNSAALCGNPSRVFHGRLVGPDPEGLSAAVGNPREQGQLVEKVGHLRVGHHWVSPHDCSSPGSNPIPGERIAWPVVGGQWAPDRLSGGAISVCAHPISPVVINPAVG